MVNRLRLKCSDRAILAERRSQQKKELDLCLHLDPIWGFESTAEVESVVPSPSRFSSHTAAVGGFGANDNQRDPVDFSHAIGPHGTHWTLVESSQYGARVSGNVFLGMKQLVQI